MIKEIPSLGKDIPWFEPKDIPASDVKPIEESLRKSISENRANIPYIRDFLICFPGKRASLNVSDSMIKSEIQGINKNFPQILIDLDVLRVLNRASALKQVFSNLDIGVFSRTLWLGKPFLEKEREVLIRKLEKAQLEREGEEPILNPLWGATGHYPEFFPSETSTEFACFKTLTQGTPLAISLGPREKQEGIDFFNRLAEETKPKFSTREDYVKTALELGADLKLLFPDLKLSVKPEFCAEVLRLLRITLKNNLRLYMRQARQATILGRQTK